MQEMDQVLRGMQRMYLCQVTCVTAEVTLSAPQRRLRMVIPPLLMCVRPLWGLLHSNFPFDKTLLVECIFLPIRD